MTILIAGAAITGSIYAQVTNVVGPGGSGLIQIGAEYWSTLAIGNSNLFYSSTAELDADVQPITVSNMLSGVNGVWVIYPPSYGNLLPAAATAQAGSRSWGNWYLQTRPTSNAATVLITKYLNVSQSNIAGIELRYHLAVAEAFAGEAIPGHRLYFNLTGGANHWKAITNVATAGSHVISIDFGSNAWSHGTLLYLAFADANGEDEPEAAYQLDGQIEVTLPGATRSGPYLKTEIEDGRLVLKWPYTSMYQLEEAETLTGTNVWRASTQPGFSRGEFTVTNAMTANRRFYRLSKSVVSNEDIKTSGSNVTPPGLRPPSLGKEP